MIVVCSGIGALNVRLDDCYDHQGQQSNTGHDMIHFGGIASASVCLRI